MFKSMLSSLNGPSDQRPPSVARRALEEKDDDISSARSNDSETAAMNKRDSNNSNNSNNSNGNGNCNGVNSSSKGKGGIRMISVKRGRKKLSSMMSKLKASSKQEEGSRPDGEHWAADSDSDDAYKSAEEACRKMSLNDNPGARRASILSKRGRKGSAAAAAAAAAVTAITGAPNGESAPYEQLKADKKYILPEEQCDIPTFLQTKNCEPRLIDETRRLLMERFAKNPDNFYEADYKRMLTDDWTVSRFLLRRRLEPKRTAKLMEECGRFRKQYKMSEVQLWEFPMEFHRAGGLFKYAPDRVGNVTMYMRVKMYRRVPEISDVFKAFILCVLEQCDVANNGRGTAVVFDLTGCGLQNVDLGFLSWLLSSFRNYCPKGVSYILVYNLPWILNATCKLAMTWMSASNKRALRFVYGDEIENFIDKSNLPDYLGGECKLNYRAIPAGSKAAIEVCDRLDMTREQAIKIRELFKEYLHDEDGAGGDDDDDDDNDDNDCNGGDQERVNHAPRRLSVSSSLAPNVARATHADERASQGTKTAANLAQLAGAAATSRPIGLSAGAPVVDLVSQASKFIAN